MAVPGAGPATGRQVADVLGRDAQGDLEAGNGFGEAALARKGLGITGLVLGVLRLNPDGGMKVFLRLLVAMLQKVGEPAKLIAQRLLGCGGDQAGAGRFRRLRLVGDNPGDAGKGIQHGLVERLFVHGRSLLSGLGGNGDAGCRGQRRQRQQATCKRHLAKKRGHGASPVRGERAAIRAMAP